MSRQAQADDIRSGMNSGWSETDQTHVEGTIVGHASPAWKNPKGRDPKALNDRLSADRADTAHAMLAEMLREMLGAKASIAIRASGLEAESTRSPQPDASHAPMDDVVVGGVGDIAAGDEHGPESNDPSLRRVEIILAVTREHQGEAGAEEAFTEAYTQPGYCQSNASRRWAVKLSLSGGAGHAGVGGAFAIGQLKNLETGETQTGTFVGGGVGLGLQTPGADPGWGEWTEFQTEKPANFSDFHNTRARLTTAGAGIAVGGYAWSWLSFPVLGVQSVGLHGPNMGALGGDASTNIGAWSLDAVPPGVQCVPDREQQAEAMQTVPVPYDRSSTETRRASVYFETGSSALSEEAMGELQALAARIAASWEGTR